jgi:hypothetical protein
VDFWSDIFNTPRDGLPVKGVETAIMAVLGPETEEYIYMSKVKVLSLAAALALPLAVNAQPAAQDWEVILSGNGSAESDFDTGQFGTTLSLGYYLTDAFEVGLRQSVDFASDDQWRGATRLAVDYNFVMDKLVPFVGANLGYTYQNNNHDDSWGWGLEGGLKYYLQSKAFLFGIGEYQMPFQGKMFREGSWRFGLGIGMNL